MAMEGEGLSQPSEAHACAGKSILVTGGTGSFGQKFVELALREWAPRRLVVFSRDELKQHEMRHRFPDAGDSPIRYFVGDVRDRDRLYRAFHDVDVVVHAAALKQVPACEYNPFEAILTNIMGAKNVIDAAIDNGVQRVIALSTDKAVNPVNLYGATKLCAEKLFVQGNAYAGGTATRFACVRYGNVIGSRGSVVPLFRQQRETGRVTVTDERMTRFWITLGQGVQFVMKRAGDMQGGEVFVPRIASTRVVDVVHVLAPNCRVEVVGIRPGEKLHEVLISEDEGRTTTDCGDHYVIEPAFRWWKNGSATGGRRVAEGFRYASDSNDWWLSPEELATLLEQA